MLDFCVIRQLLAEHGDLLDMPIRNFTIKERSFDFDRERYLTGVINLSLDSWYRESVCESTEAALQRGRKLLDEGVAIIDVGAESSLPDAERVDVSQQLDRVLPVVRGLHEMGAIVSIESYHPEVLEASARAGAGVFNLTGTQRTDEVFALAARYEAAVILCYVQGDNVREVGDFQTAKDMLPVLNDYFRKITAEAEACGVQRLFIDPGLGFYYRNLTDGRLRVRYQIDTFLNAFRLRALGYPIFNIVPHAPEIFREDERRQAEPFFGVLALLGGTHVIRTHEARRMARVLEAMRWYAD